MEIIFLTIGLFGIIAIIYAAVLKDASGIITRLNFI